jgi:hypothetical protein
MQMRRASHPTLILTLAALAIGLLPASAVFAEETLPDGRVFEKVTPTSNQDADVYVPFALPVGTPLSQGIETFFPFQVEGDGSAVTYVGDASTGGEGEIGKGQGDQYLARHAPGGGWVQSVIQPDGHRKTHFQGFSSDLGIGVLTSGNGAEPAVGPLTADAPAGGYAVLYIRNDFAQGGLEEALFQSLFSEPVAFNRTAHEFGSNRYVEDEGKQGEVAVFAGGTSGMEKLFFEANDDLTSPSDPLRPGLDARIKAEIAAGEEHEFLFESVGGEASLMDQLPGGEVAQNATFGGVPAGNPELNEADFDGAVDGGRWVYWTDGTSDAVFVRSGGVSVPVSSGPAQYWTSADDGRYAFYVEGEQLFRYDALSESRESLTAGGVGVKGVLGASADGESVYAVASGVLAGSGVSGEGAAPVEEPGIVNLYLLTHGAAPVFIASLSEADGSEVQPLISTITGVNGGLFGDWQPGLGHRTAGVSAGGGGVVFMSDRALPVAGFPHGVAGGVDEVYLFQAGTKQLFCVSCSSSGEAGGGAFLPVSWSDVHLPEWLADEGNRVFFDSAAPLVAQDTNGRQDVYEWEREGTGSCVVGSGVNGGCVSLLSGGTSEADSWFIGASESGDDAFVATRAQLSPEDRNDAFDLYDARVDGMQPVTAPSCTGTGCQGVPAPPPVFATPSSATFSGVGNLPPPTPEPAPTTKSKPKAKTPTRAQELVTALKACHKKKGAKRASCEASARKRFGRSGSKPKKK